MKTGIIIQARMASTRLPGKIMTPICEKPLLWHLLERMKSVRNINEIIVATTSSSRDDAVYNFCKEEGIPCFRGSGQDVLNRYISCAAHYHLDTIIRVTADNPLTDSEGVKCLLDTFHSSGTEYIHNKHKKGWPFGTGAELVTTEVLYSLEREATADRYREHVTPFIQEHPERFNILKINAPLYLRRPNYYLTVDYPEDLTLITTLYSNLYDGNEPFPLRDAIAYLDKNPDLALLNAGLHQGFVE